MGQEADAVRITGSRAHTRRVRDQTASLELQNRLFFCDTTRRFPIATRCDTHNLTQKSVGYTRYGILKRWRLDMVVRCLRLLFGKHSRDRLGLAELTRG